MSVEDTAEGLMEFLGPDVVAFTFIEEATVEPMYISEIARKFNEHGIPLRATEDDEGNLDVQQRFSDLASHEARVSYVSAIVFLLEDQDRVNVDEYGYGTLGGQWETSVIVDLMGTIPTDQDNHPVWRPYSLVWNDNLNKVDISDEVMDIIDFDATIEDKVDLMDKLSGGGNKNAMNVEDIFSDVMERQFRNFDDVRVTDYNDPGVDFMVNDDDQVDYGIAYEVTTRWVNPVDQAYLDVKLSKPEELGWDLVILGPRFTNRLESEYEISDPDDRDWHRNPLAETVHLHYLPQKKPFVYRPFAYESIDKDDIGISGGTPVIIPDSTRTRDSMLENGRVGDRYPVVEDIDEDFIEALDIAHREYDVITESEFRQQVREAIEPTLWRLFRPYRVEQFLVDMYWDTGTREGLLPSQDYIGRLVDRTGGTMGTWMGNEQWDIVTRGGGRKISDETEEIWSRMYRGDDPFLETYSGFRIQAEYNRFPHWDLDDWREWFQNTTEEERMESMLLSDSYRGNIDYMMMVGKQDRVLPSYSLILSRLRDAGVEIRAPDEAPQAPYRAYGDGLTIDWMLNRDLSYISVDTDTDRTIGQEEAEVFDSYLEVDVATWLSRNEIPYAHEPFTIPNDIGDGRDLWNLMFGEIEDGKVSQTGMVQAIGERDIQRYNEIQDEIVDRGLDMQTSIYDPELEKVAMLSELTPFGLQSTWNDIYDKHKLGDSPLTPPIVESLSGFRKKYILPDLVLYEDTEFKVAPEDWQGWDEWTHILEVGGLWSLTGPIDDDDEWWRWYRVSGVAFKELIYKMLGVWENTTFVIPQDPVTEQDTAFTVTSEMIEEDNYVVFPWTAGGQQMHDLDNRLGSHIEYIELDNGISPPITPTKYGRPMEGAQPDGPIQPVKFEFDGLEMDMAVRHNRIFPVGPNAIVFVGELGEVLIDRNIMRVRESQWRHESLIMLREYLADVLAQLSDEGIVTGLREIE